MLQVLGCLADPLGYVLNFLYNIVQNYGIAIILFSVLLKVVMIPMSISQQKSSAEFLLKKRLRQRKQRAITQLR